MVSTPEPPYIAVIFTNQRTDSDDEGYLAAAARMESLAAEIPGYLGIESARGTDGIGITVSYWADDDAVAAWRTHPDHLDTQARGRTDWYQWYELRVARVERSRSWPPPPTTRFTERGGFGEIRASCARVAASAAHVTIDLERVRSYATEVDLTAPEPDPGQRRLGDDESTAAFVVTLDAINFGSGYFPHLRKRPGMSGYHTVATGLRDHVDDHGTIRGEWLRAVDAGQCARIFGQQLDGGPAAELMDLFAAALGDLGSFVRRVGDDAFLGVIAAADDSAARLVGLLDEMPYYHDVHLHHSGDVLLYKRAQITAQDLALAFDHQGPGRFDDLDQLTMFADNLVPHVLRIDGVLQFSDALVARIDAGDDITVGSEEEVEIRACGLHAVELLVAEMQRKGRVVTAGALDNVLWNRGAHEQYKSRPRHRSRCVFY